MWDGVKSSIQLAHGDGFWVNDAVPNLKIYLKLTNQHLMLQQNQDRMLGPTIHYFLRYAYNVAGKTQTIQSSDWPNDVVPYDDT